MSQSQEGYDDMSTLNEIYLKKRLKGILKLEPENGVRIFFTGAYNYIPAEPKQNIHAHDYYLYVKAFHACCMEERDLIRLFPRAIEQFLAEGSIVDTYTAYEILVSQMILTQNGANSFEVDDAQMINWFERIRAVFAEHKERLREIKYGIAEWYEHGMAGAISASSEIVEKKYGLKILGTDA